jgi:hypothetical protein
LNAVPGGGITLTTTGGVGTEQVNIDVPFQSVAAALPADVPLTNPGIPPVTLPITPGLQVDLVTGLYYFTINVEVADTPNPFAATYGLQITTTAGPSLVVMNALSLGVGGVGSVTTTDTDAGNANGSFSCTISGTYNSTGPQTVSLSLEMSDSAIATVLLGSNMIFTRIS